MKKMKFIEFPMHQKNGVVIQLFDVLAALPNNNWSWRVLDFDGVGKPSTVMSMEEFYTTTRSTPGGFIFCWNDLMGFSKQLEQTWDCLIVAAKSTKNLILGELEKDNFSNCLLVLNAIDSTTWRFGTYDGNLYKIINTKFISNFYSNNEKLSASPNTLQRGPARPL